MSMRLSKSRKIFVTAAILFLAAAVADASAFGRFTMGLKGGLNSTTLRIESDITVASYQSRSEFVWGGFIEYRIMPPFSIQVEVLDSPKGSRLPSGITTINQDVVLMYEYTEVPLLIKWAQGFGSGLIPSLYAGPYWAHLREAKIRTEGRLNTTTEPLPDQRGYDLGVIFGFSLSLDLGPVVLIGDVRYGMGLVDVDETAGSTINQRVWSFTAGIGF
jgi:Outer membrane protein beta-barrel domain